MSTINASNYGDGSSSVPASAVLEGTAKAWVNLDGTGTATVLDSYNVSSLTDNGTGDYTINFSNSLTAASYPCAAQAEGTSAGGSIQAEWGSKAASSVALRANAINTSSVARIDREVDAVAYGDLA